MLTGSAGAPASVGNHSTSTGQLVLAGLDAAPQSVAVIDGQRILTARQLKQGTERWAALLTAHGVGVGHRVAVLMERSAAHIAAALGIISVGAAYQPSDPQLPAPRIRGLLAQSRPALLITDSASAQIGPAGLPVVTPADTDRWTEPAPAVRPGPGGGDTVYVMHTSGTTGRPKGVVVPHRALVNRFRWGQGVYPLGRGDRVLWHANVGFDFSVWEMLAPLAFGATVVVGDPKEAGDPDALAACLARDAITAVHFVPRMLGLVTGRLSTAQAAQLRYVFCGGATMSAAARDAWLTAYPWTRLFNQYGPTETCIDSTTFLCNGSEHSGEVPIGTPVDGTHVRVADHSLLPVAPGETGELLIGGAGLADGYLHQPERTAERFVTDPYGERLYRTGDLARLDPDGRLFHLGRLDRQIQINGVRAELGEIEHELLQHPDIQEVHVAALTRGPDTVGTLAYVVTNAELTATAIRRHAAGLLPRPLVPTRIVRLDSPLPRTHKGEVDVQALRAAHALGL
ncbi:amino acid adenylation domain-containing protein [Streptomyces sp. TRM 70351]|uniref:amino acid adenylation domain-containing protein n=1 Tax=Streptomyces sp. TRM 70351 TaxID=3116552 RepID=UPI002E7AB059|nr:amino acid adenylation domain-containing protein [Streptomyces sp. TRM 70351]MEE1926775.1 amino acid adenylation domain-containing protein [Streptomyces sp. TRM 70351]